MLIGVHAFSRTADQHHGQSDDDDGGRGEFNDMLHSTIPRLTARSHCLSFRGAVLYGVR